MDKRSRTPNAANNFLKTMCHLFKWAAEAGHAEINPVLGVSKVTVKTDGFHAWTVDQVEKFLAAHPVGTRARLAIDIMLFLGLRRSGWQAAHERWHHIHQDAKKRENGYTCPCSDNFRRPSTPHRLATWHF